MFEDYIVRFRLGFGYIVRYLNLFFFFSFENLFFNVEHRCCNERCFFEKT